ncbi:MAG TPA: hypothetical protein VGL00_03920 [Terracidiphilus sp.]|jgi:hypothetical protein
MPNITHDEIVQRFLQSGSVDFNALGKFVAEHGAQIAASGSGDYGVRIGHYNLLACFNNRTPPLNQVLTGASGIASEVTGG